MGAIAMGAAVSTLLSLQTNIDSLCWRACQDEGCALMFGHW